MRPALLPRSLAIVLSPANDPSSACAPHLRNVAVEAAVLPLPKPRARQSRDSSSFVRCPPRPGPAPRDRSGGPGREPDSNDRHVRALVQTATLPGLYLCRAASSYRATQPGRELASRASCKRRGSDARARAASSRSSAPRVEGSAPSRPRYIDPCGRCCRRGARLGRRER
jgi:hypothetical protein